LPLIRATNVARGKIDEKDLLFVDPNDLPHDRDPILRTNDIIVVRSGAYAADSAIIPDKFDGAVSGYDMVVRAHEMSPQLLAYAFLSDFVLIRQLYLHRLRAAQPHLNAEELGATLIVGPPEAEEQSAIAAYLDRKTAQIDKLIAKKRRLIELLKEERAAVINQAVTKGLDSSVKMKESGAEWIGEVPEEWDVLKLKFVAKIRYGLGQPPRQLDNGLPLIRATNVVRGKIDEKNLMFVDPNDVPYDRNPILRTNDIIVVRSGAYAADSAIIPDKFDGAISGYDMVVRANKISPQLLAYAFLSDFILISQLYLHRLRAAQPHLNAEELGDTLVLVPPPEEQLAIIAFLDKITTQIDQTITKTEKQIQLLQEYRTALISEVVTGKIDVREEVTA
jgi:type I restriction enzyme S subunit